MWGFSGIPIQMDLKHQATIINGLKELWEMKLQGDSQIVKHFCCFGLILLDPV